MKFIKKQNLKKNLIYLGLFAFSLNAKATGTANVDTIKSNNSTDRQVQISLITPIGTNGLESYKISNNISLNILAGINGGLDGVGLSGWFDIELGDVKGVQLAGWVNANVKSTNGIQFAGLANYSQGKLDGVQFSGLTSIGLSSSVGAQFSGLSSVVAGSLKGAQFSGLTSVVTESSNVSQFSGLLNLVLGSTEGFQAAGLANLSAGNKMGQLSGFFNGNLGDLKGVQASGFLNINTGKVQGLQASGFLNYTKELKGVQLGVFNYTDSIENGAVIGILSYVRNGYHSLAVTSNESFYGNVEFRTGTNKFYNIIALSTSARNTEFFWGYGYGIGTKVPVSHKVNLDLETLFFHVNKGVDHNNKLNLLNKYQITASFPIGDFMKISVGPTFNIFINNGETNSEGIMEFSEFAPYNVFSKTYDKTNVTMYPGMSIGFHF